MDNTGETQGDIHAVNSHTGQEESHTRPLTREGPTVSVPEGASLDYDEVLLDYEQLRKSLEGQKLDKRLTFVRERAGIKREDQKSFNVISKCATIAESVVKLTENLTVADVTSDRLNQIYLCGVAQLAYLREETAALFVKGEYGDNTARIYRHMQKSSVLNAKSVERLRSAVTLAAAKQETPTTDFSRDRGSFRSRGGFYRGGRGNFRGYYRGQNNYNNYNNQYQGQSNSYTEFQNRQVGGRDDSTD